MEQRTYLAIDLKSFYASAECASLGLDPLTTNLVVADVSRTEKTICLAVSPSLKAYGLSGRARLFEVVERMRAVNEGRRLRAPGRVLRGESWDAGRLAGEPSLKASYLAVKPRMAHYLEVSALIYGIYLHYAAPEDIHVYSIDEVFIDATRYLRYFGMTAHDLARTIVREILRRTGITATAGIGTNLYLAKVAMDIVAKHMPADCDGVRIAELDERSYRRLLWGHRPLTDFWRVGRGYARRLEAHGLMTMGDIARCSLGRANEFYNEDLLYRMFGVNAELLIDHAWGWEPCCISDIKRYKPSENSISSGQVLHCACAYERARLIVREMADAMALDLVDRGLLAGRLGLYVGYDRKTGSEDTVEEKGTDHYGRTVPKAANAVVSLPKPTASSRVVIAEIERLYDRIVDPRLMVRRITVEAGSVRPEGGIDEAECGVDEEHASMSAELGRSYRQLDLFANMDEVDDSGCMNAIGETDGCPALLKTDGHERREIDAQKAMLAVRNKFGRNAVLRGMNFETGATGRMRNEQIGGHAAGESRVGLAMNGDERSGGAVVVSRNGNGLGMRPVWIDGERQVFMPERQWPLDRKDSAKSETIHSGIPVGPRQGSDAAPAMRRTDRYNDILGVPYHRSDRHPPMGRSNRAAQFMPFAALTGYEAKLEAMIERINKEYQESDGYESPEIRERIASERRERIEQLARRLQAVGDRPHSVAAQRDRRRLGEVLEERYREYLEEFGTGEDYAGENHEGQDCMGEKAWEKTAGVKTARVKNAEEKTAGDGREDREGEGYGASC